MWGVEPKRKFNLFVRTSHTLLFLQSLNNATNCYNYVATCRVWIKFFLVCFFTLKVLWIMLWHDQNYESKCASGCKKNIKTKQKIGETGVSCWSFQIKEWRNVKCSLSPFSITTQRQILFNVNHIYDPSSEKYFFKFEWYMKQFFNLFPHSKY